MHCSICGIGTAGGRHFGNCPPRTEVVPSQIRPRYSFVVKSLDGVCGLALWPRATMMRRDRTTGRVALIRSEIWEPSRPSGLSLELQSSESHLL
ncbi:hypothetical protein chiPu_0024274 [Chiloscyllium punctatum]|uniref:Uncharacterized protein n=1 Tax=Chiloscyllium punctatum TaxID=137246 RepID=A0A401TCW5_CHIPU|nr:hypothetical protein [Chiloscyllium punctatum]